ncbi:MAG: serpin family protein, partial [Candidatus Omnitrophota bacterium]
MIKRSIVLWIALTLVVSSFPPGLFAADEGTGAAVVDLARADNQFAFDLYARYASSNDNIFFSPYSLSSALDMTYEGARGKTAEEMRAVLHLSGDDVARRAAISEFIEGINAPGKSYEISVANALWAKNAYPFLPDYLEIVTNVYFAEAKNMDFAAD